MFTKLGQIYSFTGNPLIDIQIAHSKKLIFLTHKKENYKQLIQKAMIKIRDQSHIKSLPKCYINLTQFTNALKTAIIFADPKTKKKIKKDFRILRRVETLDKSLKKIKQQIFKEMTQSSDINSAFVTFQNLKDRDLFFDLLKERRCSCCMKKRKEFTIGGKVVIAKKAPQPVNINWENYSYKGWVRLRRVFFSWGVYVLLYILRNFFLIFF